MRTDSDQYADEEYYEEDERFYEEDEPHGVDEYGYDTNEDWEAESQGIWRFWDEGLITLLIVGGAILFLIPEPMTSSIGILAVGVGALMWVVDWMT